MCIRDRRWAARGLLGASLFVRGPERIRALVSALNEYGKKVVAGAIDAIPAAISDAMNRLKEEMSNLANGNVATLIYVVVLTGIGLLAAMLLLDLTPRFGFANSGAGGQSSGRRKSTSIRKKK